MMKSEGFFMARKFLKDLKERNLKEIDDFGEEIQTIRNKIKIYFKELREILEFKEQECQTQLDYHLANETESIYSEINTINQQIYRIAELNDMLHYIVNSKNKAYLGNIMFLVSKIDHLSTDIQDTQSFKRPPNQINIDLYSLDQCKNLIIKTNLTIPANETAAKSARKPTTERSSTPKTLHIQMPQSKEFKNLGYILDSTRNIPSEVHYSAKGKKILKHSQISHQNSLSIINLEENDNKSIIPFSEEINFNNNTANNDVAVLRNRNVSPFLSKYI